MGLAMARLHACALGGTAGLQGDHQQAIDFAAVFRLPRAFVRQVSALAPSTAWQPCATNALYST